MFKYLITIRELKKSRPNFNAAEGKQSAFLIFITRYPVLSASLVMTTPADANRTSMTNTSCVYAVLRYS